MELKIYDYEDMELIAVIDNIIPGDKTDTPPSETELEYTFFFQFDVNVWDDCLKKTVTKTVQEIVPYKLAQKFNRIFEIEVYNAYLEYIKE